MKKGDRVVVISEEVKRTYGLHKSFYVVSSVAPNSILIPCNEFGHTVLLFPEEVKPYTMGYVNEIIKKHYGL